MWMTAKCRALSWVSCAALLPATGSFGCSPACLSRLGGGVPGCMPMRWPWWWQGRWVGQWRGARGALPPVAATAPLQRHLNFLTNLSVVSFAEGAKGPYRLDLGDVLYAPNVCQDGQVRLLPASPAAAPVECSAVGLQFVLCYLLSSSPHLEARCATLLLRRPRQLEASARLSCCCAALHSLRALLQSTESFPAEAPC